MRAFRLLCLCSACLPAGSFLPAARLRSTPPPANPSHGFFLPALSPPKSSDPAFASLSAFRLSPSPSVLPVPADFAPVLNCTASSQRRFPKFPARLDAQRVDRLRDLGVGCPDGLSLHEQAGVVRGPQASPDRSSMIGLGGDGSGRGGRGRACSVW